MRGNTKNGKIMACYLSCSNGGHLPTRDGGFQGLGLLSECKLVRWNMRLNDYSAPSQKVSIWNES
jgi:hypothetical protein